MMKITVDTTNKVKEIKNFWNHIHFHPTDAIEDEWGQRILDRIADDGVARSVRMYAMLEDIVTMDKNGRLIYDFTLNDTRLDFMISKGFDILLSYNFIPSCISSDPDELSTVCKNKTRYKGKFIVTSPPKDYSLWEEICREYTRHIVERYGIEVVKRWRLQCFNEPDWLKFFMYNETDTLKRVSEYNKLYYGFQRGVRDVSEELCMGGPALSHDMKFLDLFLKYVNENNCRLDYVCFHTYGVTAEGILKDEEIINVRNHIKKIDAVKDVLKENGFESIPMVIDEWGIACCGYVASPKLLFRETEFFSAYYTRMLTLFEELDIGINSMMLCLAGQHEMISDFSGMRNFFTFNSFAKPIYNAYKLAGKLGKYKLPCVTGSITDDFSVLPTISENGKISVLLSHCTDDFKDIDSKTVEVCFSGLENIKEARLWVIDKDNSNAYEAYKKSGSPDVLSPEQILSIREKAECLPQAIILENNTVVITMQNLSTVLIEIE